MRVTALRKGATSAASRHVFSASLRRAKGSHAPAPPPLNAVTAETDRPRLTSSIHDRNATQPASEAPSPMRSESPSTSMSAAEHMAKGRLRLSVSNGDWQRAVELLPAVLATSARRFSLKLELRTLEDVMRVCAERGVWEHVLKVYELSAQIGAVPTYRAHTSAEYAGCMVAGPQRPLLKTVSAMQVVQQSMGIAPFANSDTLGGDPASSRLSNDAMKSGCEVATHLESKLLAGLTPRVAPDRVVHLVAEVRRDSSLLDRIPFNVIEELSRACTDAPHVVGCGALHVPKEVDGCLAQLVMRSARCGAATAASNTMPVAEWASHLSRIATSGSKLLLPDARFIQHSFESVVQRSRGALVVLTWSTVIDLVARSRTDHRLERTIKELLAASNWCCGAPEGDSPDAKRCPQTTEALVGVQILSLSSEMHLRELAADLGIAAKDPEHRIAALARALRDAAPDESDCEPDVEVLTKSAALRKLGFQLGLWG